MYVSSIQEKGSVSFPEFNLEKHYMIPFMQKEGLPSGLSHWQKTVDQMLDGIETDQPIYFMADQAIISKYGFHRRPGVHVDGYWVPDLYCHGGGHRGTGGGHRFYPRHRGYGGHVGRHMSGDWSVVDFSEPEALILASSEYSSRAYVGEYEGPIGEGGDCSKVSLEGLKAIDLKANTVYVGDVGTLHESLPVGFDCCRTLVRLNCPGVTIQ